jgi:2-polyprenyl-3-methyl-5-hydroxy-6-metoxy-1,4-benzoquinol methylase
MKKTPLSKEYTAEYYLTDCDGFREFSKGELGARHKKALAYLKVKPSEKILDIGCGRGELVKECNRLGAWTMGIDYSIAAVRISRDTAKSGVIIAASATYLPFSEETFDKVTLLDVVEHLDSFDLSACFEEIHRVLRKEGILLISTPNTFRKLVRWWDRLSFRPEQLSLLSPKLVYYLHTMHVNEHNPISLKRILLKNGFRGKIKFWFPEVAYLPFWRTIVYRVFFFCGSIWCVARKR